MGPAAMGFLQNTPQDNLKLDLSLPALLRRRVDLEAWRLGVIFIVCIPSPGDKNMPSPGDRKLLSPGKHKDPFPGGQKAPFPGGITFLFPGEKSSLPQGTKSPFPRGKTSVFPRGQKSPYPRVQQSPPGGQKYFFPCFDRRLAGQIEGEGDEKKIQKYLWSSSEIERLSAPPLALLL